MVPVCFQGLSHGVNNNHHAPAVKLSSAEAACDLTSRETLGLLDAFSASAFPNLRKKSHRGHDRDGEKVEEEAAEGVEDDEEEAEEVLKEEYFRDSEEWEEQEEWEKGREDIHGGDLKVRKSPLKVESGRIERTSSSDSRFLSNMC